MAFGENWTLKVKFWLYHFIVILSSLSCLLCLHWGRQNPENVCKTHGAGYVILCGSFGEQQLLTGTGTSSSGVPVFSCIVNFSIIRILLKCHLPSLRYIHFTTMHLRGLETLGTFIQMWRHFCDSEPLSCWCNYTNSTHVFLRLFLWHVLSACIVEANKLTEWLKFRKLIIFLASWRLKYIRFSKKKTEFGNRKGEEYIFAPPEKAYFLDYCEDSEVVSCNRVKESVILHM